MYTHNHTIENATHEMPLIKYFIVYHRNSPLLSVCRISKGGGPTLIFL